MRPRRTFGKSTRWHRGGNENRGVPTAKHANVRKTPKIDTTFFGILFRHQMSIVVGTILA
jgi:hypothetical protein